MWATSCLHLGGTKGSETLARALEELSKLKRGSSILLLGDIIDPTQQGFEQAEKLWEAFRELSVDALWVKGNNDWWVDRSHRWVPLREYIKPSVLNWRGWLHTFEGGNYQNLPWSQHHDTLTLEEEQQWATLLPINCPREASVLASHFPFTWHRQDSRMFSWWEAALQKTNIQHLVFGHLHEDYLDRISDQHQDWTIQVVSDHRERVFHEVKPRC